MRSRGLHVPRNGKGGSGRDVDTTDKQGSVFVEIGKSMIRIDPNALVNPKFLNIPYILGGREFTGADCIGVAILWLRDHGFEYKYDDGQGAVLAHWWEHKPRRFIDAMQQLGEFVRLQEIRKFDCLMFVLGNEGVTFPSCLGVMVDDRHFLISTENRGSFVQMMDSFWRGKFFAAVRLRETVGGGT